MNLTWSSHHGLGSRETTKNPNDHGCELSKKNTLVMNDGYIYICDMYILYIVFISYSIYPII